MSAIIEVKTKDFLEAINQFDGAIHCRVHNQFLEIKRLEDSCNPLIKGIKIPLLNNPKTGSCRFKKNHIKEIKKLINKTNSDILKIYDGFVYHTTKRGKIKELIELEIDNEKLYFDAY